MPQAEGESAAVSGSQRRPPPQSLRDSSPAGGAVGGGLDSLRWVSVVTGGRPPSVTP